MTTVQVDAPTNHFRGEPIGDGYKGLHKLLQTIPRKDMLVVQGKFQCKDSKICEVVDAWLFARLMSFS